VKNPTVRLYVRVVLADGTRPFLDPVYSGNHKIKPGWAVVQGTPERFDEPVYYARYLRDTKRVYERLGTDPQQALLELERLQTRLELGRIQKRLAAETDGANAPDAAAPKPADKENASGRPLLNCIRSYVGETKEHKSKKTLAAYSATCFLLLESLDSKHWKKPVTTKDPESRVESKPALADFLSKPELFTPAIREMHIEDIVREHVLQFVTFLRERGNEPRTISNRVKNVRTLLYHFGLPWLLKREEMPKYTRKRVRAYQEHELDLLFSKATPDEADLLHFLLCTGAREQEVKFACWSDVDLVAKEYTVTEHRDLGFTPKDREEGAIPMSDILAERLLERRKRYPRSRLIFPSKDNKPNGHALRIVKSVALRASVNCGDCTNKAGDSCSTHPVCKKVGLHKMRKTYATRLHRSGVPARTIMGWLRHSDLSTTLLYLAEGEDDQQTRTQINAAFGQFCQIGGAA